MRTQYFFYFRSIVLGLLTVTLCSTGVPSALILEAMLPTSERPTKIIAIDPNISTGKIFEYTLFCNNENSCTLFSFAPKNEIAQMSETSYHKGHACAYAEPVIMNLTHCM